MTDSPEPPVAIAPATGASRPSAAQPRRVPDFFVVGHPKCGTSALYAMLRTHPRIFMPAVKEPRYFAPDLWSRFRREGDEGMPRTLEDYLDLFAAARADQVAGEASPSYLRSREAATRMSEVAPDARVIAILREPASFLRSFHQQSLHNHIESESDFAKALALEPRRREGKSIPRYSHSPANLLYSEHVRYADQLRRLHDRFAAERVLVLIHEEFREDNGSTLRRVLRFLGVDPDVQLTLVRTETLRAVRSRRLHALARRLKLAQRHPDAVAAPWSLLGPLVPGPAQGERLKALWRRAALAEPRPADERLMLELRRRFRGEVEAVSEYLGRDLVSLWGYDKLA